MNSLSKKAMVLALVFSSVAVAAVISKDDVNAKIAAITAPYNDENTNIAVSFTDLKVDAVRALDFGINIFASKKGTENVLVLKLQNAAYHYGDGTAPTISGDLSAQLDFEKAFGQGTLNGAADDFEQIVKDTASGYTQKYGAAVTVDAKVLDLQKDVNGNVLSMKVHIAAVMDYALLPVDVKVEDVEFKSFEANLNLSRTGLSGSLMLVMNPANKSFSIDEPGLKEYIEKLLSDDTQTYKDIADMISSINGFADSIVNQKADPAPAPQPQP